MNSDERDRQIKESGRMRGKKHLETTQDISRIVKDYYKEREEKGRKPGQKIAWCGIAVPKQPMQAMDVLAYYPEQYGTVVATRGDPQRFIRVAERYGLGHEMCGYARITIGYILEGLPEDAPLGGMARPDMLITTSAVCDTRVKWWELMGELLDVPVFILEFPEMPPVGRDGAHIRPEDMENIGLQIGREDAPHLLQFAAENLADYFAFLEEQCGRPMDQARLTEIQRTSSRVSRIRREINEYRKAVPTPMGSADAFAAMFPGTYLPGTRMADEFYTRLRAEVRQRMDNGIAIVPEEKFRLVWSGIPFWYNMGLINYFEEKGGVVVIDTQYGCAALTSGNPAREPARWGPNGMVASVVKAVIDYNCDGAVMSYTPTCRALYIVQQEIQNTLMEELGVPSLLLESDMVDVSSFNQAQTMTRIDAFIEVVLEKARERSWLPPPGHRYGPKE
jgi:benzoyl-CoA reductase/2-hydroxyglutaryl-CoA dehydratase subunit BcrC/BadD/HgdB